MEMTKRVYNPLTETSYPEQRATQQVRQLVKEQTQAAMCPEPVAMGHPAQPRTFNSLDDIKEMPSVPVVEGLVMIFPGI
jgi:hypothetical protein